MIGSMPILMGFYSRTRYRIIKEKVFLVSEVLKEAKIDASASKLGLEGFQKLIKSAGRKRREPDGSGERNNERISQVSSFNGSMNAQFHKAWRIYSLDDEDDDKPKPPSTAGFSQSKKRPKREYETKKRVIHQVLAEDLDDMSIEGQLARARKIKEVAKQKKYTLFRNMRLSSYRTCSSRRSTSGTRPTNRRLPASPFPIIRGLTIPLSSTTTCCRGSGMRQRVRGGLRNRGLIGTISWSSKKKKMNEC